MTDFGKSIILKLDETHEGPMSEDVLEMMHEIGDRPIDEEVFNAIQQCPHIPGLESFLLQHWANIKEKAVIVRCDILFGDQLRPEVRTQWVIFLACVLWDDRGRRVYTEFFQGPGYKKNVDQRVEEFKEAFESIYPKNVKLVQVFEPWKIGRHYRDPEKGPEDRKSE